MTDPFEAVEPVDPIDPWQVLTAQLARSTLWDMIGPAIIERPETFGQTPASPEVLKAEKAEMQERKALLVPFGMDLQMLSYMASESASLALMKTNEELDNLPDVDKLKFRSTNIRLGTAIAESVISHMLQTGIIKYGDQDELLGQ